MGWKPIVLKTEDGTEFHILVYQESIDRLIKIESIRIVGIQIL